MSLKHVEAKKAEEFAKNKLSKDNDVVAGLSADGVYENLENNRWEVVLNTKNGKETIRR